MSKNDAIIGRAPNPYPIRKVQVNRRQIRCSKFYNGANSTLYFSAALVLQHLRRDKICRLHFCARSALPLQLRICQESASRHAWRIEPGTLCGDRKRVSNGNLSDGLFDRSQRDGETPDPLLSAVATILHCGRKTHLLFRQTDLSAHDWLWKSPKSIWGT